MKKLAAYIEDNKEYFFEHWVPGPEYSFEQFCKDNNVDLKNQKMYEDALDDYSNNFWVCSLQGEYYDYKLNQEIFYETLTHSLSADKLIKEIQNKLSDIVISARKNPEGKQITSELYQILLIAKQDILKSETFNSLLNFYNYCIYRFYEDGENYRIVLRPNFSDEKTEYIHSQKYLFHVTTKGKLQKILKYGYHPTPNIKQYDEPSKFFVFADFDELPFNISYITRSKKRTIKNEQDYYKFYLTVIDVSKLKKEQRFFLDDSFRGAKAFYTYEPILPSAIKGYAELTEKDLSNIDSINKLIEKLKK